MKNFTIPTLLVIIIFAGLTVAAWSIFNKPFMEPAWPDTLQGIAFSPYHAHQDGVYGPMPSIEEIDADLALLSGKTHAIRTYTTEGVFSEIPRLAASHKLNVTVGAWLDQDLEQNEQEISRAIGLAQLRNVVRVIVGNEVLLRDEISVDDLIAYLDYARENIARPVSTAEIWSNWMKYPELAEHVDFIAVHILPYWEGIDIADAVGFVAERVAQLQSRFPDKPIVIAEVGWPSEGRTRYDAVASLANEATFLRRFFEVAKDKEYVYYVMEAFDQPWKRYVEGEVGAYWGIYDVKRQAKFPFNGPIVKIPEWHTLASISISIGILLLSLFYFSSHTVNTRGKSFLALIVYTLVTLVAWLAYDYSSPYITMNGIITGIVLLSFMLGIMFLMLSEAHEWIEAHWISHRRRPYIRPADTSKYHPMVSIHVPAYNEPSSMLIETLNALSLLDYPDYEVIVVDNNTKDERIWRPVQEHCEKLGAHFKFFHVAPLSGFKAGALNYALQHCSPRAEILAYIDSDYVVDHHWLNDLVPSFIDPKTAIVQAPQDYRDDTDNAFKKMCYAEYQGFFHIGMVTRNDRNAIIQHGTMTMVRRKVLEQVGAWAEWCITEDAELGLRIFEQGLEASYTSRSYGRGLMPDTYMDYKKQRYRWAYGAMQILKRHARQLILPGTSRLTAGQRYHFIAGWLPWLAQSANLMFGISAIMWSVGMMYAPDLFEVPHMAFSSFPILFFGFNLIKLFHLYKRKIGVSLGHTLAAAIAWLSLSHTIGKAMLYGIITNHEPFIRTPKLARPHMLSVAIASAFEEILMLVTLMLAIFTLRELPRVDSPDFTLWITLLSIQSIPYAASLLTSLISAWGLPAQLFGLEKPDANQYRAEISKK
jgi:exo-beta-1,3-glucanase (GH17 family)/cellulose synthase/poly-beta-1,6-N-acetylglucosamine synthase-like glycosyltransferase